MQRSLATSSIECAQLLNRVSSLLHDPKCEKRSALVHDEIEDQSGRFMIWAGNLGAFQRLPATSSLDYRLRESPKIAAHVQELLQDLHDALQNVFEIASGERPNRRYEADDNNDDEFDFEEDGYDDLHHSAADLIESHEQENGRTYLSEGQELFESMKETIASLFRISIVIRNASPRDRFARALSSKQTPFDDSFDISHVGHKFPLLNTEENQWLKERLGKAITHRRQYLRYARNHRDKLSKKLTDLWEPEDQEKRSIPALIVDWGEKSQAGRTNLTKPTSTLAPTTASTLLPLDVQVQEKDFPDDQSQTSYAFSLGDDDDESHLHLPRLSDVAKGTFPFECPLCWTIQNTTRESSWKKHGFSDMRPYVCTFEKCDVKLFSDRRDWFDHEMQNHRTQWYCHFCKKDGFRSLERFQKHLRHHHAQDATDDQLDALCEASRRPIDRIPASDCPFCDEWETKLRGVNSDIANNEAVVVTPSQFRHHVGSHMQQLALFAIPRGHLEDDADVGSAASREAVGIDKGESSRSHSSLSSFKSVHSIAPSSVTANETYQRALEGFEKALGPDHTSTLNTVNKPSFRVEPDMASSLWDMSDEDLRAFAELQEDPTSDVQIELYIYVCLLIFTRTASIEHLDNATNRAERWVALTPNDHPDRARRSEILDRILENLLDRTGLMDDLNRAVEAADMAVKITPQDHPNQAMYLSNLRILLGRRFERTGLMDDLNRAVEAANMAVKITPRDHPNQAMYLSNLGILLGRRFEWTGLLDDLNRAVEAADMAVKTTPRDHPNQAMYWSNLRILLGRQFERTGLMDDLNRAVEAADMAVKNSSGRV
ncbi:hypothetical protein K505DRAFT_290268 [Melanomma pulvis-pyrius CBS 109.77]|uniref:Oxidoreductase acuF-like C2H2 type zinc-finger domain-containing protein n=1 Tax=Melanomma pulvis-pyrius CBS 109.77 TaxID=1314802 RepID=A0A6A6WPW2_9PLEO|nr:hypothetical protein K505DRAFT_290268 [Melanomma pulvis-pyrius CBS 109.77]